MELHPPARAVARNPALALPRIDLRTWLVRGGLFAFALACALLLTAARLEITRLRYDLSDLDQKRQAVAADVRRLEVEAASLASPRRIETLARERGFTYPSGDAVILLDE